MPSSISPTLAKMLIAVMLTQPDICAMRVAIRPAVAMSPAEAASRVQRKRAPPIRSTGSVPASVISQKRNIALAAPKSDGGAAVARERLERRLVLVHAVAEELDGGDVGQASTTWPVTTARAAARALARSADPRHVVADQHVVAGEPDRHAERQPEVDPTHQRHGADDGGDREAEGVDQLGDRLGDRPGRLLLLLGDPPGEVVVEEATRTARACGGSAGRAPAGRGWARGSARSAPRRGP